MSYCLTAFGKANGRGKTSHRAINKTEGSEFTIHGKAQLSCEGDFCFSQGEMHHWSGTEQFISAGWNAEKNLSGNPTYALCTLGVFLMNMRPLESEAESELHWRIGDETVKSSLKILQT